MVRLVININFPIIYKNPLAILWGLIVSVYLIFLLIATPPLQVADEENHFLRSVQIAQGNLIGRRLGDFNSGGILPSDSIKFAHSYDDIKGNYQKKVSWDRILNGTHFDWESHKEEAGFPNTVIYFPVFYLPSSFGVEIGKIVNTDIQTSFYLARLCNVLFCLFAGITAICISTRGKIFIVALLSMPMVLSLFASCSQDGPLIATCAVCAALLTRLEDDFSQGKWFWIVLTISLGCIIASKPPYILIGLIPVVLMPLSMWRRTLSIFGCIVTITMLWSLVGVHSSKIPFRISDGVDAAQQAKFLLVHPLMMIAVLWNTAKVSLLSLIGQFIGVLGWLDAPLPRWFYHFEGILFIISATLSLLYFRKNSLKKYFAKNGLIFVLFFGTMCSVSLALYLIWTPVGGHEIEGLQGRYFIPLAMFSILFFPNSKKVNFISTKNIEKMEITLLIFSVWVSFFVVIQTIFSRYW